MNGRFLDALTHRGPGYESPHPTRGRGRFVDALTHNGPGYDLPSAPERAEVKEAARRSTERLGYAVLEVVEKAYYLKGAYEALGRAGDPEARREARDRVEQSLEELLCHVETSLRDAVAGVRESANPLDLRLRVRLRRLERAMEKLSGAARGDRRASGPGGPAGRTAVEPETGSLRVALLWADSWTAPEQHAVR
ncbi:hypothetical protein GCM10009716_32070 [Streptomyces sodiiphilus]|uniref:Uncharacterized protein n=1 Tax=Streptomyces sodiiphilus TaxID=226217 RepID=A0ABN2PGF7_9ACTN